MTTEQDDYLKQLIEEMFLQGEREGEFVRVRDALGNVVTTADGDIVWQLRRH
jgi:hypothetical protein